MDSDQDEIASLLGALQTRIGQAAESGDPSLVLDPAAVAEERRLFKLARNAGAPDVVGVEWVMGYLHWFRYQALPDGQNQDDLRMALAGFRALSEHAPQLVPADILRILTSGPPPPASDAERLFAQSTKAFEEFRQQGHPALIGLSVTLLQEAIAATAPGDANLPGYLTNLGSSLSYRFEVTGFAAYLDGAIEAGRQAAALLTPAGQPEAAFALMNLSNALSVRFERDGDGADLDAAIESGRQALAARPDETFLAALLTNLAASLNIRFDRTGDDRDLDAAIDASQQALAVTPADDENRPLLLANLARALSTRFDRDRDSADLDAAIDATQQALAVTPERASQRVAMLSNLGSYLRQRFDRDEHSEDLDAAIGMQRQAEEMIPRGHPSQLIALLNLGTDLARRFRHFRADRDLLAAVDAYKQASQVLTGTPGIRLSAAQRWGSIAADGGLTSEAANGYETAVRLLPQAAWHGLDRTTRREQLAQWAGMAASAAAWAVADGRPGPGVELLEQGRSVLWSQALNLRTDLTRLEQQAPDLAARLDRIRTVLDGPVSEAADRDAAEVRRHMAREWDEVLARVRSLDGFEHFLTATPYSQLKEAAADGPVIIVNASPHGCDCLVVQASTPEPSLIGLPDLTWDEADQRARQMLEVLASAAMASQTFRHREKIRREILGILDWLWVAVADPVLTALGFTSTPSADDRWPRAWWYPTGPLTVLPIHAAGHHPRTTTPTRGRDTVLDRVISSYTPTLTALARARQRPAAGPGPGPGRHLAVGMPATPGLSGLPAVSEELRILSRHFPSGTQLAGPEATRTAVLAAMRNCSWAHLACHAGQGRSDPDRSGLALWDGVLRVSDLAALPTRSRDLAFLSACETSSNTAGYLDETINLAAAMQFLGYRHVIATMWTVADQTAPLIADAAYTLMAPDGVADAGNAAEALHHAIRSLRETDPADPLLWTPYIHLGA